MTHQNNDCRPPTHPAMPPADKLRIVLEGFSRDSNVALRVDGVMMCSPGLHLRQGAVQDHCP